MKGKTWIIALFGAWLVLGGYACKTKKQCDCPTFGGHNRGKTGVYKTNSHNKH